MLTAIVSMGMALASYRGSMDMSENLASLQEDATAAISAQIARVAMIEDEVRGLALGRQCEDNEGKSMNLGMFYHDVPNVHAKPCDIVYHLRIPAEKKVHANETAFQDCIWTQSIFWYDQGKPHAVSQNLNQETPSQKLWNQSL